MTTNGAHLRVAQRVAAADFTFDDEPEVFETFTGA
jgi:hypothetical protein